MSFQETLIITKQCPGCSSKILVLIFAMMYGVYICFLYSNQTDGVRTPAQHINHVQLNTNPNPNSFNRSGSGCKPGRLFVVVSMQRSGSRWLESLLNSHTNVSSSGEIFYGEDRRRNASVILSTLDRVYNLEWMSKNHCCAAVGFKWMLNQGLMEYHGEIREYLRNRGVSVIFIFRRNLLRRMISLLANTYDTEARLLNGTHKAHVQTHHEAAILSRYKPEMNPTLLIKDLNLMEKTMHEALDYFNTTTHIILYYEDLIKNRTKLIDVQKFLGLRKEELSSRNVKIHKGSLSDHIKNWEEVCNILTGTSYEIFLHNDYAS